MLSDGLLGALCAFVFGTVVVWPLLGGSVKGSTPVATGRRWMNWVVFASFVYFGGEFFVQVFSGSKNPTASFVLGLISTIIFAAIAFVSGALVARVRVGSAITTNAELAKTQVELKTDAADKGLYINEMQRKVLIATGVTILAMLLYPPYREYGYGANSTTIIDTGFSWLFSLPDRATVDAVTLIVEWLGVLIIGAIAFLVTKQR